jgi:DNA-binding NarL/FixJ family response regulator
MRVLLIEDHSLLAELVSRELRNEHGYEMTAETNPVSAREIYQQTRFDLAIIDLMYDKFNTQFQAMLRQRKATATSPQLLISGLLAVQELTTPPNDTKVVIWTSAEANRRLHILYAYEELGMRVFCSKSPGNGKVDTLVSALQAAAEARTYIDPVLNSYLPVPNAPTISSTILRESTKRAVWRAIAIGARTRSEISEITGYSKRTIGNLIPEMLSDLAELDPGVSLSTAPMAQLIGYASRNWEFFLDGVIRARWP